MRRILVLILPAVTALLFSSCITFNESRFFFPRNPGPVPSAADKKFIPLSLETADSTTLSGIIITAPSRDYLIYFYGNGMTIAESAPRLYFLSEEYRLNIICFDYRGYGESGGTPSFENLLSDAGDIYEFVREKYVPQKLFLFSQSIGTVPAAVLAAAHAFNGIIMEAPFNNADEGVSRMRDGLIPPFKWLVRIKAEERLRKMRPQPEDYIKNFRAPLLILHGENDGVFPFDIGRKMYEAAGSKDKQIVMLPNTGHSDVNLRSNPAFAAMKAFFARHK